MGTRRKSLSIRGQRSGVLYKDIYGEEVFVNISFTMSGLAVSLLIATVGADTLVLRDGRRIDGQLISVQNGIVEFQQAGPGGQIGRLNRNDVLGIEFGRDERSRAPEAFPGSTGSAAPRFAREIDYGGRQCGLDRHGDRPHVRTERLFRSDGGYPLGTKSACRPRWRNKLAV